MDLEEERDTRKKEMEEKKKKMEADLIIDKLKSKHIVIERKKGNELDLSDVEPCHPAALHKPVHVDPGTGELIFPVLFMYPEFGETEFFNRVSFSKFWRADLPRPVHVSRIWRN